MARTDKDTEQKREALRFCVATDAIPYLEVLVSSVADLTSDEKVITDIDVLGVRFGDDGNACRVLFDCKSSKFPPISRAFWLAGLMSYAGAEEGFVILGRKAERAHRLSAKAVDVRLFDVGGFRAYASATNPSFPLISSYAADPEPWHRLSDAVKASGKYTSLYRHLFSEVPMTTQAPRSFRRLLSVVKEHRGELDPAKPFHLALFSEIVLAAAILLVPMIGELRNLIELDEDQREFTSALRFYLWGGRDGYLMLQRMNELRGGTGDLANFESNLLAWPQFVQLTRGLLEAPTAVRSCCMPLREISLRYLADRDTMTDLRVGHQLTARRVRQFSKRIAAYITAATRLPDEFPSRLGHEMDLLVEASDRAKTRGNTSAAPDDAAPLPSLSQNETPSVP